jgi:alpha-ketoglutarate-dependent taurine dioxygenase
MAQLEVRKLTPGFGAEVKGLDPHEPFDDDTRRALRQLFDEHGLLVFPGLDITWDEQAKIADTMIGEQRPIAGTDKGDLGDFYVSNKEPGGNAPFGRLLFHCDMMWHPAPFQVLSLYGAEVGQPAVPTAFTSAAATWDRLPAELKARVEGLHAVHNTGQQARGGDDDDLLKPQRRQEQMTTTLVGAPHPRTGRTILYISQMNTSEIVELPADESEALLEELFGYLYDPAHLYEHPWQQGDLALWDNLAIQHSRPNVALDGPARTLRKVVSPVPNIAAESPTFAAMG